MGDAQSQRQWLSNDSDSWQHCLKQVLGLGLSAQSESSLHLLLESQRPVLVLRREVRGLHRKGLAGRKQSRIGIFLHPLNPQIQELGDGLISLSGIWGCDKCSF